MGSLPIVIISGAFFFQPNQHQACETHLQNFKVLMPGFVRQMLSTDSISDRQILSTELSLESPPQLPTSYSFPPCACPEVTIHLHCRFRSSCTHSHLSPPTQKQEAEAGAKKPKQAEECTQRIFKGALLPHSLRSLFLFPPHLPVLHSCTSPATDTALACTRAAAHITLIPSSFCGSLRCAHIISVAQVISASIFPSSVKTEQKPKYTHIVPQYNRPTLLTW